MFSNLDIIVVGYWIPAILRGQPSAAVHDYIIPSIKQILRKKVLSLLQEINILTLTQLA